jgi:hypothetical protein
MIVTLAAAPGTVRARPVRRCSLETRHGEHGLIERIEIDDFRRPEKRTFA